MDKFEYKLRADEINSLIAQRRYGEAVEVADEVDWKNVKNGKMLCTVSDLYKMCKRYSEARDVLLLAYERNPGARMIIYSLCELSIKLYDIVNAVEYYKEFLQVDPKDTGRYILQYKIYEAQEVGLEERIAVLEELQKRECKEKWMYELAYLYHRVGLGSSCVEECDQIVIYFGEGKYVVKALELKKLHQPLTPDQENLYNRLTGVAASDITISDVNYNSVDYQRELASSLKEVMDIPETPSDNQEAEPEAQTIAFKPVEPETVDNPDKTKVIPHVEAYLSGEKEIPSAEMPIEAVETEIAPVETETEPVQEEASVEAEAPKVLIQPLEAVNKAAVETESSVETEPVKDKPFIIEPLPEENKVELFTGSQTADGGSARMFDKEEIEKALGGSSVVTDDSMRLPINNIDEMLSLEGDGQISLVVPEQNSIEKQITGQICIDEVLFDWERKKVESEERWNADIARKMKAKTSDMFEAFEESTRKDYLKEAEEEEAEYEETSEVVTFEDELEGEEVEIILEDEILVEEEESEPTPQELFFDRSEFVEISEESDEEPEEIIEESEALDEEAGESVNMDYLMEYAEAAELRDMEAAAVSEMELPGEILMDELLENNEEGEVSEEAIPEAIQEEPQTEELTEEVSEPVTENSVEDTASEEPVAETNKSSVVESKASERPDYTGFTEDQIARYESYIYTESGSEQVADALSKVTSTPKIGNLIVASRDKDGSVELAKAFIIDLSEKENLQGKVKKIAGSTFNGKDIRETLYELNDGALIIQDAEQLSDKALEDLCDVLNEDDMKIFVVLTTNSRTKYNFVVDNSLTLKSFNSCIEIEPIDNAELVNAAKDYAYAKEYSINEMGTLALHTMIDERQTNDHNVTLKEVKGMVDAAIKHASKKNVRHFMDVIVGKRYDQDDMIVLGEKDFE